MRSARRLPGLTWPARFAWWLAVGLGSGLAPKAPGTVGSIAALPLYGLLSLLPLWLYALVVLAAFVLGVALCDWASHRMGSHDPPAIVFDEWVGVGVSLFAVPAGWVWLVLGLVLFRIFDILKPWPVSWADRQVGGGLGIMLDDLLAGLYALVLVQILASVWP